MHINSLHSREVDLGLSRVQKLARALSLTQFPCPVVIVGGTNGKGSVVKFLESIYVAAGYRVAAYTSPHLLRFNERLRINGELVTDEILTAAFNYIEHARDSQSLTFFEFTTLAVLHICRQTLLDILILEVGLGGRLDAVNIVDADVAVITSIALDHMNYLGSDRESIGTEKIGITRPHKPLVCGDAYPPKSVLNTVSQLNIPFYALGQHFSVRHHPQSWDWVGPEINYLRLPLPTLKLENAATSLMVVDLLQARLPVTQFGVMGGVKKAKLEGRFEVIPRLPKIILDVAHNPQSMNYLAQQLQQQSITGKILGVVGMLRDKDIEGSLEPLMSVIDVWYLASLHLDTPRGATAAQLEEYMGTKREKNCYNFPSVATALATAVDSSNPLDCVVVFGSFYTVALAKQYLAQEKKNGS